MKESEHAGLEEMTSAVFAKLGGFFDVDDTIRELFHRICQERVQIGDETIIVAQDSKYNDIFLLESGWVMRSRLLADGSRQIVNMAVPGDFVALNALLFDTSDFELRCQTDVEAYRFDSNTLSAAFQDNAQLATALFWANANEESMLAERIVSLGRRSARARIAHVLCEFIARLEIIGVDDVKRLIIPVSQEEMSDILGISIVHTNKTLRKLERDGILAFRNSILMVHDEVRLRIEAGFEDGYLHFTRRADIRSRRAPAP